MLTELQLAQDYWYYECLSAIELGHEQDAFRAAFILSKLHNPKFDRSRPADYAAWHAPRTR